MTCHICAGNTCLGECEPPIAYIDNLEREVAELEAHINVLREALEISMINGDYLKNEKAQLEKVLTSTSALKGKL